MKRIDAIVKGASSLVSTLISRKSQRIMRGVEQAIAFAEDKVDYYKDTSEDIINNLGDVSGAEDSAELSDRINSYVSAVKSSKDWLEVVEILKALKTSLNSEVKLEKAEKNKKNEE